jgi:hypothetical protein
MLLAPGSRAQDIMNCNLAVYCLLVVRFNQWEILGQKKGVCLQIVEIRRLC